MAVTHYGPLERLTFGVQEIPEIAGFLPGRIRIRMRNDDFARVFVKTDDGIKVWIPKVEDGKWAPGWLQGENKRIL